MARDQKPHWQPISALPVLASMIDGQLAGCRDQYQTLLQAEDRQYVLDDATVDRVQQVFGDTADDLWLYDEQLGRWRREALTPAQRREVERLGRELTSMHEVVDSILGLAARLKDQTIETLLAKSDLEVGLAWLQRNTDR